MQRHLYRKGPFALQGSFTALVAGACVSAAGCSSNSDDASAGTAANGGVAGTTASAGAPPLAGRAPATSAGAGGQLGMSGAPPISGGASSGSAAGSNPTAGAGASSAGVAGANAAGGAAGASVAGAGAGANPAAGNGGSVGGSAAAAGAGGSSAGASGAAGRGGSSAGGPATAGSTGADITCPAGATFCSGFEANELPAGTKFHAVGPTAVGAYTFDTTQPFAGRQSLSIPMSSGGFYYRALAVPVPGQNFWVRLHVRVSRAFGDDGHDSLFGASTGSLDADVNNEALVEFSEQFNEVLLNTDDKLFNPATASTLEANAWHCIEAHYDGVSGDVQIFAGGKEVINAPGYAKLTFQTFRIGYMQYHDTRSVWFDDVVVAPTRINCP